MKLIKKKKKKETAEKTEEAALRQSRRVPNPS